MPCMICIPSLPCLGFFYLIQFTNFSDVPARREDLALFNTQSRYQRAYTVLTFLISLLEEKI